MKRTIIAILSAMILLNAAFVFAQTSEQDVQFKELYRQGIEQVKQGQYKDAYENFEKALLLKPSSDLIRYMIQETGDLILKDMLGNPELHQTALRILEMGKGAWERVRSSPEEMMKLVADLDGAFDKKWEAINMLAAIGQRATPFLIEKLADKGEMTRTNAMHALEKIGNEAVLPLLEALKSSEIMVRQNAAIVLGVVRDERAVPDLKKVCEDVNESIEVKRYAIESLKKITGKEVEQLKTAREYYYELAEKYYYKHPSVMINFYGDYIVWRWNAEGNTLKMNEVPDFTFNQLLAENCCYSGLELDRNYEPIWSLLACVLFAKYSQANMALQVGSKQGKSGELDADILTKLQADLAKNMDNAVAVSLAGKGIFYKALERSLKDNRAEVAVACIKALSEAGAPEDLPGLKVDKKEMPMGMSLVDALSYSDKRVRYAVAEALVKINPVNPFPNMEKVIPLMNEALGESGMRMALLIEPNSELRSALKMELNKLNIYIKETLSAEEGLKAAKAFPTEDLIILNSKLANEVVFTLDILGKKYSETVYNSLKDDIRTKGIPIILIDTKEEIEKVKNVYQESIEGYLITPLDRILLAEAVNKVLQRDDFQSDSKTRALKVCADAATALAEMDLGNSIFPYAQSVNALVGVLENRPDNIRMSALTALSRFANPLAILGLTRVIPNKENSLQVRVKATEALGNIFRVKPGSINPDAYEILKKALVEDEMEIKQMASIALGNAQLTTAQRKELISLKRPEIPGE